MCEWFCLSLQPFVVELCFFLDAALDSFRHQVRSVCHCPLYKSPPVWLQVNCDLFEGADLPVDFSWIRVGFVRIDLPDVLDILGARKAIRVLVQDVSGTARPRTDYHFSEASVLRSHMENQLTLAIHEFLHHGSKPHINGAGLEGVTGKGLSLIHI